MSYTQLVQPNLSVTGRIGWCLEYAFRVFDCTHYEPSAWQAWTNTQFKHQDADLPQDVAVPMWYSYWANLDGTGVKNWGHVTINVPGQGIYSSPWKAGTTHAVLTSINEVERIYGVKYVGWSEDILQLKVIGGEDMITQAFEYELAKLSTGSYPGAGYNSAFVGTSNWDGMMAFWQEQSNKSDKAFEDTLAQMQTGSKPGKDYNYQFDGVPVGGAKLIVDFWNKQPRPASEGTVLKPGKYQVN